MTYFLIEFEKFFIKIIQIKIIPFMIAEQESTARGTKRKHEGDEDDNDG